MVDQEPQEIIGKKEKARKRGGKSFPVLSFNEALVLAKGIVEHSAGKQMRRLTLFDKLKRSPTSGPSRLLVTISVRYGLTTGSYAAEYIAITNDALTILSGTSSESECRQQSFQLAIQQQSVFQQLYERLKGKRLPALDVIKDELAQIGVPVGDRGAAAEVFIQNIKDLQLIHEISGKDTLLPIEQVLEELPSDRQPPARVIEEEPITESKAAGAEKQKVKVEPNIQLNIEIHIAADTQNDKIKVIFENMKKYLLTRNNE